MKLLYKALEDALTKFCRKGIEPYLKNFVEQFLSTAYFRIPKFRKVFLECILQKSNEMIPEWTNTNWNLDSVEDEDSSLSHLINWDAYFYS